MVNRLWGPVIILFWLGAMSWLFWHDVRPLWVAQDPPRSITPEWLTEGRMRQQAAVEDKAGQRIGGIWTVYRKSGETIGREDLIVIDRFPPISPARVEVDAQFDAQGRLDEMTVDVGFTGVRLSLNAERFGTQLAFVLKAGPINQSFKISDTDAGMVGDLFKPFSDMPKLEVGQTWKMQVFNPLSTIFGHGRRFMPMVVRVTGKQRWQTEEGIVDCFVVESPRATALVGPDGTVYRQETQLPVGGTIVIRTERFDERAYERAKAAALPRMVPDGEGTPDSP
ncbi:MAG: hypothetical protein JXB13_20990 [Phycisphaerae bacterium]|nr:hypothetical protein [Phycisphaerae bacterium]